jgi:hypothetical protein
LAGALVPLAVMWLLLLTIHTHRVEGVGTQTAALHDIPISVISNPDAPGHDAHWHPGTLVHEEPCAACLLSHSPGSVAAAPALAPSIVACQAIAALPGTAAQPRPARATARAPPVSS